jgi:hypothetical protein
MGLGSAVGCRLTGKALLGDVEGEAPRDLRAGITLHWTCIRVVGDICAKKSQADGTQPSSALSLMRGGLVHVFGLECSLITAAGCARVA